MNGKSIERVKSSVVFGGLKQSIVLYQDHLVVINPSSPVSDAIEVRYDKIYEVYLYTGVVYATLTLGIHGAYREMVRWLPKRKAARVAALIRERASSSKGMG